MQPFNNTRQRGLLNDLNRGLAQQMFFWGRDVLTDGNLLKKHGFERLPAPGPKSTSRYRRPWDGGLIELHGHCAGWYPETSSAIPGFMFVRTLRSSYAHHQSAPVTPGCYKTYQDASCLEEQMQAGRHFCGWLSCYEQWIISQMGLGYREECFAMFRRLPESRPWLTPDLAMKWWQAFAAGDACLTRARRFAGPDAFSH